VRCAVDQVEDLLGEQAGEVANQVGAEIAVKGAEDQGYGEIQGGKLSSGLPVLVVEVTEQGRGPGSDRRQGYENGSLDAERVEHGAELAYVVCPAERPGLGAVRPPVAKEVEGHGPPRRQERDEPIVDPAVIGEAEHEDQGRFIAGAVGDVQPSIGSRDLADDGVAADINHGGPLL
jgi:hypothetical protein